MNPYVAYDNLIYLTAISYELNNNPFTFLSPPPTMEGEYYEVSKKLPII